MKANELLSIDDSECEFMMTEAGGYSLHVRALAREVLRLRALEKAVRQLVESKDIEGTAHDESSFAWIHPGEIAEILNRAERAK